MNVFCDKVRRDYRQIFICNLKWITANHSVCAESHNWVKTFIDISLITFKYTFIARCVIKKITAYLSMKYVAGTWGQLA